MARVILGSAVALALSSLSLPAFSQSETSPATGAAAPASPMGAPTAPNTTPPTPDPGAPSAPAPATPSTVMQAPATPPAAGYQPAPAASPNSQPYAPEAAPNSQSGYAADGYAVGHAGVVEPPAPPPPASAEGFEFPDISVRVDPLNWIIYGRLGLELEAAAWKFVSVEVVPVFVTDSQPPVMNFRSFPGNLYQESNGLGAMSGASIGAGFWLNGKPFKGTVLRVYYANYGYHYVSKTDQGVLVDEATHTDRHIVGYLGSHSKWGPFTIASGIGLGMELNRERRCITETGGVSTDCPKEVFNLKAQGGKLFEIYDWLHPAYLTFRLSLGFVF